MNSAEYSFLLSHPEAVDERQTDALEKIITEFPYFQSARALRLKGLYNQNSFQYNYALKVTAAYTTDRSVLFDFITSDTFTAIQKGQYEEKPAETVADAVTETEPAERQTDMAKQSILTSIREAESHGSEMEAVVETEEPTAETSAIAEAQPEPASKISSVEPEIDPEEFGPVFEEDPQFLPEAIAPVEYSHVEFVPAETETQTETVETAESAEEAIPAQQITEEFIADEIASADTIETNIVEETPEQKLEIGKPLEFSKDETHSFAQWLQLTKLQPIVRDEPQPTTESKTAEVAPEPVNKTEEKPKVSKDELIDRFIESNPKMPKINPEAQPVAIESKEENPSLMTETLARVYLEQKKYQKAIQAYEILILKYPEKSSFFADRISEIKNLQQNNTL